MEPNVVSKTWGDSPMWGDRVSRWGASSAAGSAMMEAINSFPRDGLIYMVYCPGETPEHVAALWGSAANEEGGVAWEGLMFAEPLLADVVPDGPQNATHWYLPPTVNTVIAPQIDPDAFKREYEAAFEDKGVGEPAPHEQFTQEQRSELLSRGLRASDVKIWWLVEIESHTMSDFTSTSIFDDRQVIRTESRRPCPILTDFRPRLNQAYVVWPHGDIGIVDLRDQNP